jgi:hypothetical protein
MILGTTKTTSYTVIASRRHHSYSRGLHQNPAASLLLALHPKHHLAVRFGLDRLMNNVLIYGNAISFPSLYGVIS